MTTLSDGKHKQDLSHHIDCECKQRTNAVRGATIWRPRDSALLGVQSRTYQRNILLARTLTCDIDVHLLCEGCTTRSSHLFVLKSACIYLPVMYPVKTIWLLPSRRRPVLLYKIKKQMCFHSTSKKLNVCFQSSHEDYEIDRVKKILNIVINPVADDIVDVRVNAPSNLDTGSSEPVIVGDRTPVS